MLSPTREPLAVSMNAPRPDDSVKDYYDDWTGRYIESFGDIFQAARARCDDDLIAHVVRMAGMRGGMRVLDAGCGVCGPSIRIARIVDVAIDAVTISPVQAELARERVREAGLSDRITVHLGDFAALPTLFEPDRFDRIFFLESLCHARDLDEVTRGCREVLRPGGQVYVKDFYRKPYEDPQQRAWSEVVMERVEKEFVLSVRDISEVCDALARAGLYRTYCTKLGFDVSFTVSERFAADNRIDVYVGGQPINWGDWYDVAFHKR